MIDFGKIDNKCNKKCNKKSGSGNHADNYGVPRANPRANTRANTYKGNSFEFIGKLNGNHAGNYKYKSDNIKDNINRDINDNINDNVNRKCEKRILSIIKREGDILKINKAGIIDIIRDNRDNMSKIPDEDLIRTIYFSYGNLTMKQYDWICEKIKYVIRNNQKYQNLRGIRDILFIYGR